MLSFYDYNERPKNSFQNARVSATLNARKWIPDDAVLNHCILGNTTAKTSKFSQFTLRAFRKGPSSPPWKNLLWFWFCGQSAFKWGPPHLKQALLDSDCLSCLPVRDVIRLSLTSFFFLLLTNSRAWSFSAFRLAFRSAFTLCAASWREALINSLVGSLSSSLDSSDSSSSESDPEESSDEEPCF